MAYRIALSGSFFDGIHTVHTYYVGRTLVCAGLQPRFAARPDKLNGGTEVPRRLKSAPHMSASICERIRGVSSVALKAVSGAAGPRAERQRGDAFALSAKASPRRRLGLSASGERHPP